MRDCVGAIQLLSDDDLPRDVQKIDGEVLDEANIARLLRNIVASSAGAAEDNFRISIAGAQEKTAFLLHNGKWLKPLGATPTTHIFKLPLGVIGPIQADMSGSVENEWLCSRIMTALGLPVAQSSISSFEDQKVLIVERFDRRLSSDGSWWMRLPQEDFCQATGTHPDSRYESEGGPGIVEIMDILLGSRKVQIDRKTFFKTQILYWVLAAPDGHAKNFSLHIEPKGRFTLAPLYDVMSAHPVLGHDKGKIAPEKLRMAMAALGENRHYEWSKIHPRHWVSTAVACGIRSDIETIISELFIGIPEAVQAATKVLPKGFPASISDPIFEGALEAASRLDPSTSSNTF